LADPQNQIGKVVLILFVVLLAFDLAPRILNPAQTPETTTHEASQQSSKTEDAIPEPTKKKEEHFETQASYTRDTDPTGKDPFQRTMNTLHVSYCTSWSYKSNFEQLKNYLGSKHTGLYVTGSEYPLTPTKALLSKLLTIVQYALYALLFFGQQIFDKLGMPPPAIYYRLTQNKAISFIMIMLVMGNINSMLTSSGAFEIEFNDQLIFSKIRTGRMPDVQEIENILAVHGI